MKVLTKILSTILTASITISMLSITVHADENSYKNEVFGDVGIETNSGERTQNTGYNQRVRSERFNNKKYDSIPVIDVSVERIGLDWAGYSYYGGRHYSYEAFDVLKSNGCNYVLLYLGQSPWNGTTIFNSNDCRVFVDQLKIAIENAHKADVKIGLIWEGNAVNTAYAYDEADYVCWLIKNNNLKFDLPLFYAPEYSADATTWEDRTTAVKSFFDRLSYNKYGGPIGLYTNGFTNQGAVVDANKIIESIPDLCLWVPAYDNYPHNNPNFDNILYMHQYTGDYGVVPAREHTMLNGIGYMLDISMAFVERPDNTTIYTTDNSVQWNKVDNADAYKLRIIKSNYTYDEIITTGLNYEVTDDVIKVYVKPIRTDKFGFTAESYNWSETPNDWRAFDFDTIDLSEYYQDTSDKDYIIDTNNANTQKHILVANSKGYCYDLAKTLFGK